MLAWATRLIDALVVQVRTAYGDPILVQRSLVRAPGMAARVPPAYHTIALSDVPCWHEAERFVCSSDHWPRRRGHLQGWIPRSDGRMAHAAIERPEYAQIGRVLRTDDWSCEIQDVTGLGASKSDLTRFATLDEMVQTSSPELIAEISPATLRANLAHREIRILHDRASSDCFVRHDWDGRLFLSNSGGSHHFAAARLVARLLGVTVPLRGTLYRRGVNAAPIAALRRDFAMKVVRADGVLMDAWHQAMERSRVPWFFHHLPRQLGAARVVLLPRSDTRASRVAAMLDQAGAQDFGLLLAGLATDPV